MGESGTRAEDASAKNVTNMRCHMESYAYLSLGSGSAMALLVRVDRVMFQCIRRVARLDVDELSFKKYQDVTNILMENW